MSDAGGLDPSRLVVEQESLGLLVRHARISAGFLVDRVLELSLLEAGGLGGIALGEVAVEDPWHKDYDAIEGNRPTDWPQRFDLTHWGLLGAYENHDRVGGAVIAYRTAGLEGLDARDDLAMLWDLRVAPASRGHGIGRALFHAAAEWARVRGCREFRIETQNINVAACRFYARMGCSLRAINARAYPEHPGEAQLLWYCEL